MLIFFVFEFVLYLVDLGTSYIENWISEPWHGMMFVVVGWLLRWLVVNEQTVLL